jgi:hypothetical protein
MEATQNAKNVPCSGLSDLTVRLDIEPDLDGLVKEGGDVTWGHHKDAMYRPGPLRELLDKAIAEALAQRG